jgi:hypothetical protein
MTRPQRASDRLPHTVEPPCRTDPDRWLDPSQRPSTLAACLQCPARRWCAQHALATGAQAGMWAGIWIDGPADAITAGYLRSIADAPAAPLAAPPCGQDTRPSALAVSQLVVARSSGHCEILGAHCQLSYDIMLARTVDRPCAPSDLFAACALCAETVAALPGTAAQRFGYRVTDGSPTAPFFWRQTRWVLLLPDGQMEATTPRRSPLELPRLRSSP